MTEFIQRKLDGNIYNLLCTLNWIIWIGIVDVKHTTDGVIKILCIIYFHIYGCFRDESVCC